VSSLHHHLAKIGMGSEAKVTMRLWVLGQIISTIGLILGLAKAIEVGYIFSM